MKPAPTVKMTEKERTALSKFLNIKSYTQFPKQQTEMFCRICNMLDNTLGKKEFTVAEFKMISKEIKAAVRLISKMQSGCRKIIEKALPKKN